MTFAQEAHQALREVCARWSGKTVTDAILGASVQEQASQMRKELQLVDDDREESR